MATIKDIAKALNLSPATVSRALNGFPEVKSETRAKVQDLARSLDYRPNVAAQRLVSGQTGMVALIVKYDNQILRDPHLLQTIGDLSSALIGCELDLIFHVSKHEDELEAYRRMANRGLVDGFIVNAPVPDDPRIEYLIERDLPFVVHGRDRQAPEYAFFDIDNYEAARQSTELLLNFGHRNIAYIGGDSRRFYAAERFRAYHDEIKRHGLKGEICEGENTAACGYQSAKRVLTAKTPPTALIADSTLVANGIYVAARELSHEIGKTLSVVAHDDAVPNLRAKEFDPALTVTRSPLRDAAEPMAKLLKRAIAGEKANTLQTTQAVELILRQSTSTPQGQPT